MTEIWSAPSFRSFDLREFENEAVLFDARDGRTHYLSPAGAAIVAILARQALDAPSLLTHLEEEFGVQFDAAERIRILAAVKQLTALGLISCAAA